MSFRDGPSEWRVRKRFHAKNAHFTISSSFSAKREMLNRGVLSPIVMGNHQILPSQQIRFNIKSREMEHGHRRLEVEWVSCVRGWLCVFEDRSDWWKEKWCWFNISFVTVPLPCREYHPFCENGAKGQYPFQVVGDLTNFWKTSYLSTWWMLFGWEWSTSMLSSQNSELRFW